MATPQDIDRAEAVTRAVNALNSCIDRAHEAGLSVEIEQLDVRAISEPFGQPRLRAIVERREIISAGV